MSSSMFSMQETLAVGIALISPSTTYMAERLHRLVWQPSTLFGPPHTSGGVPVPSAKGVPVIWRPSASVREAEVSATNSISSEPASPWSFFQAVITAPSLTQTTYTLSIPASSSRPSISAFLSPGTWHVDQVGVKAPGSVTTITLRPVISEPVVTGVAGVGPPANPTCTTASVGKEDPTVTVMGLVLE